MKSPVASIWSRLVLLFCAIGALTVIGSTQSVRAADDGSQSYAKFTAGKTSQKGLFTLWRTKQGDVFLELTPAQLSKDFIIAGGAMNGNGACFTQGDYYHLAAKLIRFERYDDKIAIVLPNTKYAASPAAEGYSVRNSYARSVLSVAKISAIDTRTGDVVISAAPFLGDVANLGRDVNCFSSDNPFRLDRDQTYVLKTKAFPRNVLIEVAQTWLSEKPASIDVPDPRSVEVRVAYNIVQPPDPHGYVPRLADPRVGYFDATTTDFSNDQKLELTRRYIVRWNFKPADPSQPISRATNPIVFYLSNEIPVKYRDTVRKSLLAWNAAFAGAGIADAIQVRQQPSDPNWEPDDIRYSVIRWVSGGGGAEAELLWDPRTGEEIRTGVVVWSGIMGEGNTDWHYFTDPSEASYAEGARQQAQFGRVAMSLMDMSGGYDTPMQYNDDFLQSIVMHESGHDMGLQHNFVAGRAYTADQVRDKAFTDKYGIVTSVMMYTPLNVWPKGTSHGLYFQTVLGPYDYYAIHWGYARVPGARTPDDEVPTLNRWAAKWSNPWYRFASDMDAGGPDPRVDMFDLTTDPLSWCGSQVQLDSNLLTKLDSKFPYPGEAYDRERNAFQTVLNQQLQCATRPAKYLAAGTYLSRAHRGDPGAAPAPMTPVSRADQLHAMAMLDKYLLSDDAFHFSPATLNRLDYSQYTGLPDDVTTGRHDFSVAQTIGESQSFVLERLLSPDVLVQIDEMAFRTSPGSTMSLADLFDWMQSSVFGDLSNASVHSVGLLQRNLQRRYGTMLMKLAFAPPPNTPPDAQALARAKLLDLRDSIHAALARGVDEMTRAHLENMLADIDHGLDGKPVHDVTPGA